MGVVQIKRKIISPLGYILLISFLGFVSGVLYVSLKDGNILLDDGILNEEVVFKLQNVEMDKRAFLILCLGNRLRDFLLLLLLAYSSINIIFNTLFFGVQGFFVGSVMEVLAIRFGVQGLFIYVGLIFPHGIFYVLGYICLGCWCLRMEMNQENGIRRKVEKIRKGIAYKKIMIAFVSVIIGILLETYVNTIILQLFWK